MGYIFLYWLVTSIIFIITPILILLVTGNPIHATPSFLLNLIICNKGMLILLLFGVGFIFFLLYNKFRKSIFLIIFIAILWIIPMNVPLLSNLTPDIVNKLPVKWPSLFSAHFIRMGFLLLLASLSIILLYCIVFYKFPEKLNNTKAEFFHRRYLAYLNHFIWISIFGLLQFFIVYNQIAVTMGGIIKPDDYPRSIWLLQVLTVCFIGGIIVLSAFHIRLKEIEGFLKNDS